ncbi:hypothetical protein [Halogeometricum borinquense]|uniref:hypothetical protein n=1 Tax=Halogeometricum borinquense TaxID=60847 RepID=UPI001955190C|nr:hypothetical protein [Halogeometricum borinquense]
MPLAFKADEGEYECPGCGRDDDVVYFDKDEGKKDKRCLTCQHCGAEWSEWRNK